MGNDNPPNTDRVRPDCCGDMGVYQTALFLRCTDIVTVLPDNGSAVHSCHLYYLGYLCGFSAADAAHCHFICAFSLHSPFLVETSTSFPKKKLSLRQAQSSIQSVNFSADAGYYMQSILPANAKLHLGKCCFVPDACIWLHTAGAQLQKGNCIP